MGFGKAVLFGHIVLCSLSYIYYVDNLMSSYPHLLHSLTLLVALSISSLSSVFICSIIICTLLLLYTV